MKIAMPNEGEMVNQHFGKSKTFWIATIEEGHLTDTSEASVMSLQHNHGGLSDFLINQGVSLVITGGIGMPALNALKEQGLSVIRGASGTCTEVLDAYLKGTLNDQDVVCNHHGDHDDDHPHH